MAILSVLALLAGALAQAHEPVAHRESAPGATFVICSDGQLKTVSLDAPDGTPSDRQQCRHCPDCTLPLIGPLAQSVALTQTATWLPAVHPQPVASARLSLRLASPLPRGPPTSIRPEA